MYVVLSSVKRKLHENMLTILLDKSESPIEYNTDHQTMIHGSRQSQKNNA